MTNRIQELTVNDVWRDEQDAWNNRSNYFVEMHNRDDRKAQVTEFLSFLKNENLLPPKDGCALDIGCGVCDYALGLARTWPKRYADASGKPNQKALSIANNPQAIANHCYAVVWVMVLRVLEMVGIMLVKALSKLQVNLITRTSSVLVECWLLLHLTYF